MRVFITGVGGALGSRVAELVESLHEVEAVAGLDVVAPRRELTRTEISVIDPRERRLVTHAIRRFEPTAVIHLGIYEPNARATPRVAEERTASGTTTALGAAAESGMLDRIVVRSGLEIYGRRTGTPQVPDETVVPDPTTSFGRTLLRSEQVAQATAETVGATCSVLRFASIVGPDFPSPLARYLRLPLVPLNGIPDAPFSLLHADDAARAIVAALRLKLDGPLNIAGAGAVTAFQTVLMGGHRPLPIIGPWWAIARAISNAVGSPVPDHLLELLQRGRVADLSKLEVMTDLYPEHDTLSCARALHGWNEPVTPTRNEDRRAERGGNRADRVNRRTEPVEWVSTRSSASIKSGDS
jgi:UDP-glucose 4-epimerase